MKTKSEFGEPWSYGSRGYGGWTWKGGFLGTIITKDGDRVYAGPSSFNALRGETEDEANERVRRIVACVNVCAGVPTEVLEQPHLKDGFMDAVKNLFASPI